MSRLEYVSIRVSTLLGQPTISSISVANANYELTYFKG